MSSINPAIKKTIKKLNKPHKKSFKKSPNIPAPTGSELYYLQEISNTRDAAI